MFFGNEKEDSQNAAGPAVTDHEENNPMKKMRSMALLAVAGVLMTGNAMAADVMKEEKKLQVGIDMLNADSKLPQAEKVLTTKLTDEFGVKQDKITTLRKQDLGYGEIAAIFAMAGRMEGGITDKNINRVMSMHKSRTSWNQIASTLKLDLADVADRVNSFEDSAHDSIKEAALEVAEGRAAGGAEVESDEEMKRDSVEEPGAATGGTGKDPGGKY